MQLTGACSGRLRDDVTVSTDVRVITSWLDDELAVWVD